MFKRKPKKFTGGESETLKSLRNTIKEYQGYDDVKIRASTDKALRNYLYDIVLDLINIYSSVQNQLMQGQLLSTWAASNQILNMLNELRALLTSDVYRHSTFFETPDVSENIEISVIYLLESETILELRATKEEIQNISEKLTNHELFEIEKDIFKVKNSIEEISTTISDRAELIASFEIVGF